MPITRTADAKRLARLSAKARAAKAKQRKQERKARQEAEYLSRKSMTVLEALDMWPEFAAPSWDGWRTVLAAIWGLPVSDLKLFRDCTGRITPAPHGYRESWLICGRRSGKSRITAAAAVYMATCVDHAQVLARGERGRVLLLAADRAQARVLYHYVVGMIESVPMLEALVEVKRRDSLDLKNQVSIEIATSDFRAVRGYTTVGLCLDETAFWASQTTTDAVAEVLTAVRPSMGTVPTAKLFALSTPYSRKGTLYRMYEQHYGVEDSPILLWRAGSRTMNPTLDQAVIQQAREADPVAAASEYDAEFRSDLQSFVDPEVIAAATQSWSELPPLPEHTYYAFTDASGGRSDSYALAIAHVEDDVVMVDSIRERKAPFSPDTVTRELAEHCKSYGIRSVLGDRYAASWPSRQWEKNGLQYKTEARVKSDLYLSFLPLLNSGRIQLPNDRGLAVQFESLERRQTRAGKEVIDHPRHQHDDLANCVAGVALAALDKARRGDLLVGPCELLRPPDEIGFAGFPFEPFVVGDDSG
jgi:hypothetical protein